MDKSTLSMLHRHHYVSFKSGIGDPGDYCDCGEFADLCEDLHLKLKLEKEIGEEER